MGALALRSRHTGARRAVLLALRNHRLRRRERENATADGFHHQRADDPIHGQRPRQLAGAAVPNEDAARAPPDDLDACRAVAPGATTHDGPKLEMRSGGDEGTKTRSCSSWPMLRSGGKCRVGGRPADRSGGRSGGQSVGRTVGGSGGGRSVGLSGGRAAPCSGRAGGRLVAWLGRGRWVGRSVSGDGRARPSVGPVGQSVRRSAGQSG